MMVWASERVQGTRPKFHKTPFCVKYQRAARGRQIDLRELTGSDPCLVCFPDAPRYPRMWKRHCSICNKTLARACAHNGGVLVDIPTGVTTGFGGSARGFRTQYVWPENARYYDIALV
jgi:hypothetical protein